MEQPSSKMPEKASNHWSTADLVDFEYALSIDRSASVQSTIDRDRAFVLTHPSHEQSRSRLFLEWTRFRRKSDSDNPWPGHPLSEAWGVIKWVVFLAYTLVGGVTATSLLVYNGERPINVAWFLAILVIPQILLSVFSIAFTVVLHPFGWVPKPSGALIGRLIIRIWAGYRTRLGDSHLRLSGPSWREMVQRLSIHRKWIGWQFYTLIHLSGVALNLGVLVASLFLVAFSDRAFGWQSTMRIDPASVHSWVKVIALPWSGLWGEGVGYPTLAQIESSKVTLNAIPALQNSQALASWWSFLLLSITFYGLLPRALLTVYGGTRTRICLAHPDLSHSDAEDLWNRMHSERVGFRSGRPDSGVSASSLSSVNIGDSRHELFAGSPPPQSGGTLLASSDLIRLLGETELLRLAGLALGTRFSRLVQFPIESTMEPNHDYTLMLEAWEPPIEETLHAIRELSQKMDHVPFHLLMTGVVTSGDPLLRPSQNDMAIWTQRLKSFGIRPTSILTPTEQAP